MRMVQTSNRPALVPPRAVPIEQAALRAVVYADVFDYPLQPAEIHRYLHGVAATPDATAVALARHRAPDGPLSYRDGFYTLRGREGLVELRQHRATYAKRLWPKAVSYGRLIAGLPFVRMVAVTGSLAWNNVDEPGDIDYLVVTEPGRLWLCRWFIAALRRVARLDGVPLCPNYVVSTRALLLGEQNLYGAYELARMTPIAGLGTYRRLRRANPWAHVYLPNAVDPPRAPASEVRRARRWGRRALARLTRLGERSLRSSLGTALERWEMAYRIRKRANQLGDGTESAFGPDRCQEHTGGHRQRALAAFADRLRTLGDGAMTEVPTALA